MGTPGEPKPDKYFVALLASQSELLSLVESDLVAILGAIDARSKVMPWAVSKFYEKEMGSGLLRRFLSFEQLRSPQQLADIKLRTQEVEERYRSQTGRPRGRRVNIDPGYLDSLKVVLASTKNASQRIYLHSGIFAETTLHYHDGDFHGLSYTYADYLWPDTLTFLTSLRAAYLVQLRELV